MFKISKTCFAARTHVQINSSRYSEGSEFLPTTFAVTLSAVALLIVLKVEFNFEVILCTQYITIFVFLTPGTWNKTHLKAYQSQCLEGEILHQRGLFFSFCRLTTQPALIFKHIAQQLSQCLRMARHVYHYFPSEQMGLLKRANHG